MNTNTNLFVPTRNYINALAQGDSVTNVFGEPCKVERITAKGNDVNGNAYVLFYTENENGNRMSHSFTENKLVRTFPLCQRYTSHELDTLETIVVRRNKLDEADDIANGNE